MKKTSKEYAEKLADGRYSNSEIGDMAAGEFVSGYLKAIEETNVEGLLEACKALEKAQPNTWHYSAARSAIREALKKSQ